MTIEELVARCKASVTLRVNEHRDMYQSVDQWLDERGHELDIPEDVRREMNAKNTSYCLQFYPLTPIGFYVIYGATLEYVLVEAEKALDEQ